MGNSEDKQVMGHNKNAMDRYLALDKCFQRSGGACIDDLMTACEKTIGYSVSKKTIYDDIAYMEANSTWQIELEKWFVDRKRYYAYKDRHFSISSCPFREEDINLIRSVASILQRYKGLPGAPVIDELTAFLKDRFDVKSSESHVMSFEENEDLIGREFVTILYDAIVRKQVLHIVYHPFGKSEIEWNIHPYFLKQYNGRWFLFGLNNDAVNGEMVITHLALDRIKSVKPADIPYIESEVDFGQYFDDVIGVTINPGEPIDIVLKFSPQRFNFVRTKPIHPYQIEDEANHTLKLNVIPNKELESLILSFGDDVEVISPENYRQEIKRKIKEVIKKYDV